MTDELADYVIYMRGTNDEPLSRVVKIRRQKVKEANLNSTFGFNLTDSRSRTAGNVNDNFEKRCPPSCQAQRKQNVHFLA